MTGMLSYAALQVICLSISPAHVTPLTAHPVLCPFPSPFLNNLCLMSLMSSNTIAVFAVSAVAIMSLMTA